MNNENINLKGGVLIIGSLLWQDHLNEVGDDIRKTWRANHLLTEQKIMVKVPIRYGRYSAKSRIYTMTFSKAVTQKKLGTAYFVPFRNENLLNTEQLHQEAIALSAAEGMNNNFVANWGAVLGVAINEQKIDKKSKVVLTNFWRDKLSANNNFHHETFKINKSESSCIKANGILNFKWIRPVDSRQQKSLDSYDFFMATATKPTDYPSLKTLAENVKNDKTRYYFIENYKNGITTFQDIPILNQLS